MKTIWKYELGLTDTQTVLLPIDAKVLSGHCINGSCFIWAEVDTEELNAYAHTFHIRGTGHKSPESKVKFIATVLDLPFVWHIWQEIA